MPGKLTEEETAVMQTHVRIGYDLVSRIALLAPAAVNHEAGRQFDPKVSEVFLSMPEEIWVSICKQVGNQRTNVGHLRLARLVRGPALARYIARFLLSGSLPLLLHFAWRRGGVGNSDRGCGRY
jgi:hypothetical protein